MAGMQAIYTVTFKLNFKDEIVVGLNPSHVDCRDVAVWEGNTKQTEQLKKELGMVLREHIAGLNECPESCVIVEIVEFTHKKN